MKEIVLQEVPPPYDTEDLNCDENNPNIHNVNLWNEWIKSIDYLITECNTDLQSSKNKEATLGGRGVRIVDIGTLVATLYHNVKMGYKIKN